MRSIGDIEAEMSALEAKRDDLKLQLRQLEAERNAIIARDELLAMSPQKRAALAAAVIGVSSIASAETVGTPGQ